MVAPTQLGLGLVVDLFAGGGGASIGLERALGRSIDIAINHDATALAVHAANHPNTEHFEADIWEVKPIEATRGQPVDVLWASPACTHFSVAKGGRNPLSATIRSLAWVVTRWAKEVRPRVIFVENVPEFQGWGPLGPDRRPCPDRKGKTFRSWVTRLRRMGYAVEWKVLDSANYGAPTRRRRLFVIARCDGAPIVWPAATHGKGLAPFRTAAECIDWSIACPSIFERERPLAAKTMWRIAEGIRRYVINAAQPFIVKVNHGGESHRCESLDAPLSTVTATQRGHAIVAPVFATIDQQGAQRGDTGPEEPLPTIVTKNRHVVVAPTLIQTGYGEREGQRARVPGLHKPLGTIISGGTGGNGKHALVAAFLNKHFGGVVGQDLFTPASTVTSRDHHSLTAASLVKLRGQCNGASMDEPMPAITAQGMHVAEVRAFLTAYYGNDQQGQSLFDPTRTLTTKDRLGLVTVEGDEYQIVDIGMRMLEPHELLRAQFGEHAEHYDMSAARTKSDKVRLIGNSVVPQMSEALARANCGEWSRAAATA